ncbi:hypothetical protein BJX76DRAFT_341028 [Aspergillus varians]
MLTSSTVWRLSLKTCFWKIVVSAFLPCRRFVCCLVTRAFFASSVGPGHCFLLTQY